MAQLGRSLGRGQWPSPRPQHEPCHGLVFSLLPHVLCRATLSAPFCANCPRSPPLQVFDTITPGGRLCMFPPLVPEFRLLTGYESMRMIGIPDAAMDQFLNYDHGLDAASVDALLYDLGGNAFSGGVVMALFLGSFVAIPMDAWLEMRPEAVRVTLRPQRAIGCGPPPSSGARETSDSCSRLSDAFGIFLEAFGSFGLICIPSGHRIRAHSHRFRFIHNFCSVVQTRRRLAQAPLLRRPLSSYARAVSFRPIQV